MGNEAIKTVGQTYIMNTYGRFPLALVKGKGTRVWDADGKSYLDFIGGIAVCILGHSNNDLNAVLREQAEKLWHVSNLYWIEPQVNAAEKLATASELDKVFFCNSGAEANEAAFKLARKYHYRQGQGERHEIISFMQSFHGRTLAAVTATGQLKYQQGFGPLPPGFIYADFNDLDSVEKVISEKSCAIIVEPVQGEGGVHPADRSFLKGLREICDREGILLIFDEVQCGMARSGKLFAFQKYGIKPDILTVAKGLGGGFPIGAMLATENAASGFEPGDHASTFGGNPLATAVASKVLDIVTDTEFLNGVKDSGQYLLNKLAAIDDKRIVNVRGLGLMVGMEFNCDIQGLINSCINKGLLLIGAGPRVLRFVPPLNISREEIEQAVAIVKEALQEWTT